MDPDTKSELYEEVLSYTYNFIVDPNTFEGSVASVILELLVITRESTPVGSKCTCSVSVTDGHDIILDSTYDTENPLVIVNAILASSNIYDRER